MVANNEGERDDGGHGPDGGLQARAERPAGPPRRERRDEEDGEWCQHEHKCQHEQERERGLRPVGADRQPEPGREHDSGGGAEVGCEPAGAQPPRDARATHRQPASTTARYTAAAGGR